MPSTQPPVLIPGTALGKRLRIEVFGRFAMTYDGKPVKALGRKTRAWIGYLVLSDQPKATRGELTGLLWSETDEDLARGSLRHALHEAQVGLRAVGFDLLEADKNAIGFPASDVESDVWDVLSYAKRRQIHPLLLEREQIVRTALAGLDDVDQAFATWVREKRQSLLARLIAELEPLLPSETASSIDAAAEQAARAISMLDPGHEASARAMIRARWQAGDVGSAFGIYKALWDYLEREFDAEPSPQTQDLIAKLRLEQPESTAPPSMPASTRISIPSGYDARPSIAVLPFQTLGPADETYFGDGIVDDIIQGLAGLKDLFVIARGSTLKYRDAAPDVQSIGRDLGVRYVLHGNVQRSGQQLRIHTTLADAESGEVIKPTRYAGKLDDLFDLQDQIAVETTKSIAPYIRERELRRAMRKHPNSMSAYDLVLQALGPMYAFDYASFSRARGLLERAMAIDPSFAPAWSYAALWHIIRVAQEWTTDVPSDVAAASKLAERGIGEDPEDANSLAIFGYFQSFLRKDHDTGLRYLDRAISIRPNFAFAWTLKAAVLTFNDPSAAAVQCAERGVALSPNDHLACLFQHILSQAHYVHGEYEQALVWGRRSFAENSRMTSNMRILIATMMALGARQDAKSIVANYLAVSPSFDLDAWEARTPLPEGIRQQTAQWLRSAGLAKDTQQLT